MSAVVELDKLYFFSQRHYEYTDTSDDSSIPGTTHLVSTVRNSPLSQQWNSAKSESAQYDIELHH